jgi:prolyl-tRNA editing enzyme YbaK/EbsC (Cys-tRNA(Pro) deacylase)
MADEYKNKLSKSAQAVQSALLEKGLVLDVMELSASTRTANDAAKALDCNVAQIIKSLLFCTQESKQPVLILASGVNRVNEKIIAKLVGENIQKADADFTREVTGFVIGGVPPIGHKQVIKYIFIDEDLLQLGKLWTAAGTPNAVFSLASDKLLTLTGGQVVKLK